jgi:hypothetical protein
MRDNPLVSDQIHFNPSPVRLVLTLREDYLSQLEEWKSFFPSLMRNRMALHLLRGPQALEAVVRPARLDGRNLVDDSVAEEIVRRIAGAAENTPMEDIEAVPPLLSLLCDELNRERGDEPTISLRLVQERHTNILQAFYERSFTDWPPALRRMVEDRLVTVAGHRNSIAWEDAEAELCQAGVKEPQATLKALVTCRLLSIEERGRHQRLELTHEVTPLVVESRDKRQERERTKKAEAERQPALELAAQERQQRQRWRRLTAVVTIACLLACGMTGWAILSRQAALQAEKKAVAAQSQAMLQRAFNLIENDRGGEALAVFTAILRLQPENKIAQDRMMSTLALRRLPVPLAIIRSKMTLYSAVFSPDGSRILTASIDYTARVWDLGINISSPSKWFLDLVEAVSGQQLNDFSIPISFENPIETIQDI